MSIQADATAEVRRFRPEIRGGPSAGAGNGCAAAAVRGILSLPEAELDYGCAKLALDRLVDPATDADAAMAELDRLAEAARALAGPGAGPDATLAALRRLIYEPGPWNEQRPFDYDDADFRNIRVKLLSHYLETRRGNCVSMPLLFLILAEKLGLDMSLALAPAHLFLHFRNESDRIVNLEATSGALPARDVWVRQERQVPERGIESGFYMRTLGRREAVAAMALTVVEHLMGRGRFADAAEVSEAILRHGPRNGLAWANLGQACFRTIEAEFLGKYGSQFLIPLPLRSRYLTLLQRNRAAFAAAEALGWEPRG